MHKFFRCQKFSKTTKWSPRVLFSERKVFGIFFAIPASMVYQIFRARPMGSADVEQFSAYYYSDVSFFVISGAKCVAIVWRNGTKTTTWDERQWVQTYYSFRLIKHMSSCDVQWSSDDSSVLDAKFDAEIEPTDTSGSTLNMWQFQKVRLASFRFRLFWFILGI